MKKQIAFVTECTEEDYKAIEVLKWLFRQKDFANAFAYTNELARKFLLEDKVE